VIRATRCCTAATPFLDAKDPGRVSAPKTIRQVACMRTGGARTLGDLKQQGEERLLAACDRCG
jgi:hypothetical protein